MHKKLWKSLSVASSDLDKCIYRLNHSLEWDAKSQELLIIGGTNVNENNEEGALTIDRLKFIN
jgi:hypothetical protein